MRKSKMAFVWGEKRVIMHNVNQSGQYSVDIFERTNRFTFVQLSIQNV